LFRFGLQFQSQDGHLGFDRLPLAIECTLPGFDFLFSKQRLRGVFGLLGDASRAGEQTSLTEVYIPKLNAMIGQKEFADLVRVSRSPGLENVPLDLRM